MTGLRDYLQDILDCLDNIEQFTIDGHEMFVNDRKTQFAVIRAYEVIGEIVKLLADDFRDNHPQIDWQQLMNFREFWLTITNGSFLITDVTHLRFICHLDKGFKPLVRVLHLRKVS